ncbi:MAG: MurR/RpiR family transcriptional regulator [Anaerolineae bacterium]|jgi:DNA-binding MurR/RpiR family transcriptional regulator|nr:MurR/RpiR family transcriptional regulator [Anaerolineae bacterium]MDH7472480.1 MurR/RpiR family transcriptional regulator [Anaerolineae bacterium]
MFQERIRQTYAKLSPNKKKIADFLMSSPQEAAFMSASQLARHLKVDVATVVRFAQDIGYSGYPPLAREVQSLVRGELKIARELATGEIKAESPFIAVMLNERENIEQALTTIPAQTIQQVTEALRAAKYIYIIAQGESLSLAHFFAARLRSQGLPAEAFSGDTAALAPALGKLTAGDLVVGVSHSKAAIETAGALQFARERGAKTVGLVSTHASPVAHVADTVIICPSKSMTAIPSFGSLVSVMDAIWQILAGEAPEKVSEQQAALEQTYVKLVESQGEAFAAFRKDVTRSE